ncbi:MAG: hypothetical protein AAFW89_12275 [Bacteroidota bacterium]
MNSLLTINCILLLFLSSGCDLQEAPPAVVQPEPNGYMKAVINGESWSGDFPRTGFTFIEQDTLIQVFASQFDSVRYPYNDTIVFSYFYQAGAHSFSVLRKPDKHEQRTGGFYVENDGDAIIAWYYPIEDSVNTFTVEIKKDEENRVYAEGTFSMKVVIDPVYDNKEPNNTFRQQPDTVLITNGEYRIPLNDISNPRNK